MSPTKALLTGAGGFVGAHVAERLLDIGVQPLLLLRPGSDPWRLSGLRRDAEIAEVDLRDPVAVRRTIDSARADWIFHLAAHGAYSWQADARVIFETNLMGTLNLLEAATDRGFQTFIHAGSSSEYGFKDHAPNEDEAPEPNSYYAVAKVGATLLGQYLAQQGGLNVTTLRLSSVYGPWEEPRRVVPTLIATGMAGRLPPLAAPETSRDFVYVDDVCDAFLLAATTRQELSPIYNVGSGIQTSLRELVEIARDELGVKVAPDWGAYDGRSWDARVWVSNPTRIEQDLGWRPEYDLRSGFALTVAWLRDHSEVWGRYGVV